VTSTDYYDRHGEDLAARYDGLKAARLNAAWAPLLDQCRPGLACDIGAGSGRDARWLAGMGWEVVAVEPSAAMRESGARRSTGAAITWLDDTLPDLRRLRDIGYRFDLILLAAVWQHVPPPQRQRAVRILSELLRPGGRLVITLRHGRNAAENRERGFHAVSAQELGAQARERALVELLRVTEPDLARDDLDWETVVYELPDDGTGSLALLRHVIVNDDKSSSYKLALLRVLARIAETLPGAVITATDDWVEIPLGLVALLWLKQYRPLLKTHSYAVGASGGVGFANDDFHALLEWPDFDLHIGAGLTGQRAKVLTGALRACCKTIKDMPTRYITWPGQNRQVFDAFRAPVRRDVAFKAVDAHYLAGFGRSGSQVSLDRVEKSDHIDNGFSRYRSLPDPWSCPFRSTGDRPLGQPSRSAQLSATCRRRRPPGPGRYLRAYPSSSSALATAKISAEELKFASLPSVSR
jgi:SAM-dependent methyltransferase